MFLFLCLLCWTTYTEASNGTDLSTSGTDLATSGTDLPTSGTESNKTESVASEKETNITNNSELQLMDMCPPREDIPNCRCEKRAPFGVMVDCVEFPYPEYLRENLDGLFGIKIGMLNIAQPEFLSVGAEFFQNVSLYRLDINEWNITSLKAIDDESKSFLHALRSSIVHLGVVNCQSLEDWDWTLLQEMKQLSHLYITATPVKTITKTISLLTNLQAVTFYGTKTDSVEAGALSGLNQLVALTIKDNNLLVFSRDLLPSPALNLHYLGLGANNISTLPDDMFSSMPKLKYLEIDDNYLRTLEMSTLAPVFKQLLLLNIEGNPFNCDQELKWLVKESRPEQNDFNETICQSPPSLSRRNISSLTLKDLE